MEAGRKKIYVELEVMDLLSTMCITITPNFKEIVHAIHEDVCESADEESWHSGDVLIAFRRWIESQCTVEPDSIEYDDRMHDLQEDFQRYFVSVCMDLPQNFDELLKYVAENGDSASRVFDELDFGALLTKWIESRGTKLIPINPKEIISKWIHNGIFEGPIDPNEILYELQDKLRGILVLSAFGKTDACDEEIHYRIEEYIESQGCKEIFKFDRIKCGEPIATLNACIESLRFI